MNRSSISIGIPPSPGRLYVVLLSFIDNNIDEFKPLTEDSAEDAITADLSRYLTEKAYNTGMPFMFTNQDLRADIGVHGRAYIPENSHKFCWIEAKRLPTPKGTRRDEREYVFVDHSKYEGNGGIERFKLNKHGLNKHGEGLPVAIMIGYVQEGEFDNWVDKVNEWLKVYSTTKPFHNLEFLQQHGEMLGRYYSHHERYSAKESIWMSPIDLYHFWIKI